MNSTYLYVSTKVCGWLFAVVAVAWLCVAGYFWSARIERQHSWEKATATVTAICGENGQNSTIKYSLLTFTDPGTGQSITVRSQMGASERPIYPVGDEVEVIFPAGEPNEAVENNVLVVYLLPAMITLGALMFGVVSFVSLLVSKKLAKKIEPPASNRA